MTHSPISPRRRRLLAGTSSTALIGIIAAISLPHPAVAQVAPALPTGGSVVSGNATVTTGANRVDVHQSSATMVANWTGFDIGAGNSVVFHQPDASSIALNRVVGGGASQILGNLSSNGQVWLLNPNGVVFGKGASVDVGGLVASSLSLSDADFAAGRLRLTGGTGAGAILNHGTLGASGGVVALVGPAVTNTGTIATPGGSTVLAAGDAVSLDFAGDGLVSYRVDRGALGALVDNSGSITAGGGLVVLTARAADAATASVINNAGVIRATALVSRAGRIMLDGDTANGVVNLTGSLDTTSAVGQGGLVAVSGRDIALAGAPIDASGATGGGTVKIGGGRHGLDTMIATAAHLTVDAASTIRADATDRGNGGEITAWSDDTTEFAGKLSARGGALGGNGGQLEVSGKQSLRYAGLADALATRGRTGDLLLDPTDITIEGGAGTSGNWTSGTGNVTVYAETLEAQTANVLLEATGLITFNDLNGNGGDGDIVMQRNVSFRAETLNTSTPAHNNNGPRASIVFTNSSNTLKVSGTGSIYLQAGGTRYGSIGPGTGTINLIAGDVGDVGGNPAYTALPDHDVDVVGSGTPSDGSITLLGADGLLVSGNITTHGGYVRLSGDSDAGGGGGIQLTHNITTGGGNLYVYFGNSASTNFADIGGQVSLGAGRLVFGDEIAAATNNRNNLGESTGVKRLSGLLDLSGNVNFSTPLTMLGGANIRTDGDINFTSTVDFNTGSQALTLRATNISFAGATLQNTSTANIVLEPYNAATNIALDGNDGIIPANSFTQLAGVSNLTVGRIDGTGTTTISSSGFSFNAGERLTLLNGGIRVDGLLENTGSNGAIVARAGSTDVTIGSGGAIRALGTGTAVIAAAARNFVNNGGANALLTANGRWLTYSTNPTADTNGGLTAAFKQYAATYNVTTVAQTTGNGHLYTVAPLVSVSLIDTTSKIYDGNTTATLTLGNFSATGGIDGDDVSGIVTGYTSAAYADRNVGTAKSVTASGVTLGTAQNGNVTVYGYGLAANPTGLIGTITRKTVSATSTAANKVYDGNTTASVTSAIANNGAIAGDNVSVSGTGTFADANAGIGKMVSVSGLTLAGTDAGNYQLSSTTGTTTATITRRTISAASGAFDKVYDGTTATSYNSTFVGNGVVAGDQLTMTGAGTFDTRNAGSGKTVTFTNMALSGAAAGNYQLAATTGSTTGTISQRAVSVIGSAQDKVYDGTTAAVVGAAAGNLVAGDTVALIVGGGAFDTRHAGSAKTVTLSGLALGGADAANYTLASTSATATAAITPRSLTAVLGAQDKVYDGTTAAMLAAGFAPGAVLSGDDLGLTGSAQFDTRNVGAGKAVTIAGLSLTGANAGDYQLTTTAGSALAAITPRTITAVGSAQDKVYDGTTVATVGATATAGDIVAGDLLTIGVGNGVFATRDAGVGKMVTLGGLTLSGADAGNYRLASAAAVATATIAPRVVTALLGARDKTYDATTAATVDAAFASGAVVAGDDLRANGVGQFDTRHAGVGKTVTITGLTLSGADAANYRLSTTGGRATATISPRALTALLSAQDKVYDGTTSASVTARFASSAILGNDDLRVAGTGQFDTANAGLGKAVTISGLTLSGADAANYRLITSGGSASAAITPRTVTTIVAASPKAYDGTTLATLADIGFTNVVAGDTLTASGIARFDTAAVGSGKSVTVTGLTLSGANAGNYRLASTSTTAQGDVLPRLEIAGVRAAIDASLT